MALAIGASACCLSEISGVNLDGGRGESTQDGGDAGGVQASWGCPADQLCRGIICFCEPNFCGCPDGGPLCFYETDAGCIHAVCPDGMPDDNNCGSCGKVCHRGTHCAVDSFALECVPDGP